MAHVTGISADRALIRLKEGNAAYVASDGFAGDVSRARRTKLAAGQAPFAVIIACSDSRVVPEAVFSCGLGELFVIRVAGNVMDDHQLGSVEYAAGHLGTNLVVVLGHTHCGAVDAAMNHDPDGYIKFITDEIRAGIGEERDPLRACAANVRHSIACIEESLEIRRDEAAGLLVAGAILDIETGAVTWLD